MADKIVVEGAPRATRGKNEARRLRQAGKLPAVLYGGKGEAIHAGSEYQAGERDSSLRRRHNTLFQVDLGGKHEPAILKELAGGSRHRQFCCTWIFCACHGCAHEGEGSVHTFGEPSGVKVRAAYSSG